MDEHPTSPRALIPAVVISGILILLVVISYIAASRRQGTIVLPGGTTYLGPSPTTTPDPQKNTGKITVPVGTAWKEQKGAVFPYRLMLPQSLALGVFPNDPYDAITVFIDGTDAGSNIFFRVENLTTLKKESYKGNLRGYATDWWKDYAWKGVASVSPLTNSQGLSGFRATYKNEQGQTPYDHVFLEVPGNTNLVIWISGKLFTTEVFDKIVDSVSWQK